MGWYQQRSRTAARRFVAEVGEAVKRVGAQPEHHGWHDEEFREASVRRFPYILIFRVQATGKVLVVAVAHTSREPGYWRERA